MTSTATSVDQLIVALADDVRAGRPFNEIGALFLGLTIAAEAEARRVPLDEITEEQAKKILVAASLAEAQLAKNSTIEKAYRKAAEGDLVTVGRLISEHMLDGAQGMITEDEAKTHRRRNRQISSRVRGDALTKLIRRIVEENNGQVSVSQLKTALENDTSGVIDEITPDEIWYVSANGTGCSVPLSGLRGRLSRAKKWREKSSSR